jgi:hypothetical protein
LENRRENEPFRESAGRKEADVLRRVRARRVQSWFRSALLTSCIARCAITDLAVPELLVANQTSSPSGCFALKIPSAHKVGHVPF